MAQLPPKIPISSSVTPNWPVFSNQKVPSIPSFSPHNNTTVNQSNQNPSWVDEFLDFSAARRGLHRRSISDSITFLESPMLDECRGGGGGGGAEIPPGSGRDNEFERYDDEQFMSMFNDDISKANMAGHNTSSSNPSTPSDQNSFNGEKETENDQQHVKHNNQQQVKQEQINLQQQLKHESEEAESDYVHEGQAVPNNSTTTSLITDPKRVKRILANRQSAQRSRVRKLQYVSELERSVTSLQAEVSVLSPRVAFLDHQRLLLNVDNSALKQRIAALAQDKIFKDAHQEALKREIERLRKIYQQQNLKKMEGPKQPAPPSHEITAEKELVNA